MGEVVWRRGEVDYVKGLNPYPLADTIVLAEGVCPPKEGGVGGSTRGETESSPSVCKGSAGHGMYLLFVRAKVSLSVSWRTFFKVPRSIVSLGYLPVSPERMRERVRVRE